MNHGQDEKKRQEKKNETDEGPTIWIVLPYHACLMRCGLHKAISDCLKDEWWYKQQIGKVNIRISWSLNGPHFHVKVRNQGR